MPTGSLAATRPTFGGSLLCTIYTLNYRPQMATVRPRVMPMPERVRKAASAASFDHPLGLVEDDIVTKVLSLHAGPRIRQSPTSLSPTWSSPAASASDLRKISSWCDISPHVLGAEFGCSRPLVQKGWVTL